MQLSPEQKKALEEQKAQCIFCQIITGKIPSKEVFSDDKLKGLLDINPASKGHTLLMPQEHYPIMPLIPEDEFKQMFTKTKAVEGAIKKALLCNQNTIFIANGGAAGQQSMHFMLHIIPREKGDGLPFEIEGKDISEEEKQEMIQKVAPITNAMLTKNLAKLGFVEGTPEASAGSGKPMPAQKFDKRQVLGLIDANPHIKQIILEKPEQFKQLVPQHEQLRQIFQDFDLDEIITEVKQREEQKSNAGQEPKKLSLGGKKDE